MNRYAIIKVPLDLYHEIRQFLLVDLIGKFFASNNITPAGRSFRFLQELRPQFQRPIEYTDQGTQTEPFFTEQLVTKFAGERNYFKAKLHQVADRLEQIRQEKEEYEDAFYEEQRRAQRLNNHCTRLRNQVESLEIDNKYLAIANFDRSPLSTPISSGNGTETDTDYS